MLIFNDMISGARVFDDSYPYELIDDCLYEVKCTPTTNNEETDPELQFDVVIDNGLRFFYFSRDDYRHYLKEHALELVNKWNDMGLDEADIRERKDQLNRAGKMVLQKIDHIAYFYLSEGSEHPGCVVGLMEFRQLPDGSGEEPIMIFLKASLECVEEYTMHAI
uniref:Translationally-controlled tumor n=1 Tax=Aceria tosichella TaxID=561515 RepID=A0A6G1SJX8_9ACAR